MFFFFLKTRLPPLSKSTSTCFPYATLFLSDVQWRAVVGKEVHRRVRVVSNLLQQAAEADAVGRGQCDLSTQGVVGQRLLGQALAVVEGAGNAERAHVVAPAAEAVRLAR